MKSVQRFETCSDEATLALGRKLAEILPKQGVVLLIGELGAGKTTLAKGIVEGRKAAAAEDVSSPTFTLIHEYGEPVSIYHVDLYRLDSAEQAGRLGLEELWERPALVLIEWGNRFPELIPEGSSSIYIEHAGAERRFVELFSGDLPASS